MEYKGHDLTISYRKDGKVLHRDMEVNEDTVTELARIMAGLALVTLSAVYGDRERVIDVACEGRLSYAVITEVGTGVAYTYLDPRYTHLFTPSGTFPHVFTCADPEGVEQDETYREAAAPFTVNGAGCPALHVCRDKQVLFQIIRCFLADGTAFTGADWLKSCI